MHFRLVKDRAARWGFGALTVGSVAALAFMIAGLLARSAPLLKSSLGISVLTSMSWHPQQGEFGMLAFLVGTVYVTGLAMLFAVPVSLLTAIFLAEYAPRLAAWLRPLIDLLSGIPSVVYGVWGVLTVVPAVEQLARWRGVWSSGYSLLAGGIVLAVMVCPFIIHVAYEVLNAVPAGIREASLSLGATRWQTIKHVVLRRALPGIVAAVVLGLSRALGETIAVLMVAGNVPIIPRSLFDPVYPLPALLANNYGEMMSIPLYDAALLFSALLLLVVVLFFNGLARVALNVARRGIE